MDTYCPKCGFSVQEEIEEKMRYFYNDSFNTEIDCPKCGVLLRLDVELIQRMWSTLKTRCGTDTKYQT